MFSVSTYEYNDLEPPCTYNGLGFDVKEGVCTNIHWESGNKDIVTNRLLRQYDFKFPLHLLRRMRFK